MALQISPSSELKFCLEGFRIICDFGPRKQLVMEKIDSFENNLRHYHQAIEESGGPERRLANSAGQDAFDIMVTKLNTANHALVECHERLERSCSRIGRMKQAMKNSFCGFAHAEQVMEYWEKELRTVFERGKSVGALNRPYEVSDTLPQFFVPPRQVCKKLLECLKTGQDDVVVLNGMFGMGKSALALYVALTLQRGGDFPGGVFVLRFGENYTRTCSEATLDTKILQELKTLLLKLGHRRTSDDQMMSGTTSSMRSHLKRILPKKYLIVLDNVWSDRIVQAFLFEGHEGKLLVTAREHIWSDGKSIELLSEHYQEEHLDRTILAMYASGKSDVTSIEPIFQVNTVFKSFTSILNVGFHFDQEQAESVLKKCQGCPLAIAIIGVNLKNQGITEWDKELPQHAKDVVSNFSAYCETSGLANGYTFTIFRAIQQSVDTLTGDQLLLFQTLDIFAPSIPLPCYLVEFAWYCKTRKMPNNFKPYMDGIVQARLIQKNFQGHYIVHSTVAEYLKPNYESVGNILSMDCLEKDPNISAHKAVLAIYLLSYGNSVSRQAARQMLELKDNLVADGTRMEVPSEVPSLWEMSKDQALIRILKASVRVRLGLQKWTHAHEELNEVLILDSKDVDAICTRGALKINLQDFVGAIEDLNRANELEPHNASTFGCRARAWCMLGIADTALNDAKKALALDAKNAYALSARGAVKIHEEDFDGALEDLNEAKKLDPDDAFTLIHRSEAMCKLGIQLDAALDEAYMALQLNDKSAYAFRVLGELKIKLRDFNGAIQDFNKADELNPNDAFTLGLREDASRYLSRSKLRRCLGIRHDKVFR